MPREQEPPPLRNSTFELVVASQGIAGRIQLSVIAGVSFVTVRGQLARQCKNRLCVPTWLATGAGAGWIGLNYITAKDCTESTAERGDPSDADRIQRGELDRIR